MDSCIFFEFFNGFLDSFIDCCKLSVLFSFSSNDLITSTTCFLFNSGKSISTPSVVTIFKLINLLLRRL